MIQGGCMLYIFKKIKKKRKEKDDILIFTKEDFEQLSSKEQDYLQQNYIQLNKEQVQE